MLYLNVFYKKLTFLCDFDGLESLSIDSAYGGNRKECVRILTFDGFQEEIHVRFPGDDHQNGCRLLGVPALAVQHSHATMEVPDYHVRDLLILP